MPPEDNTRGSAEPEAVRPATYGEKAVGLSFNPSGDEKVQKVKELYAEIIDFLNDLKPVYDGKPNEVSRMLAIAPKRRHRRCGL